MKALSRIALILISLMLILSFTACGGDSDPSVDVKPGGEVNGGGEGGGESKPEKFTVTINAANGTDVITHTLSKGDKVPKPDDPVKPGYTFTGWVSGGEAWNFDTDTVSADTPIGATWQIINYEINLDLGGGVVDGMNPTTYNIELDTITLLEPTKAGYRFDGWVTDGSGEPQKNVTIPKGSTGNVSYCASWTAVEYNITVDLGGGNSTETYPSYYTVEYSEIAIANPTRYGYEFLGWTTATSSTPVKDLVIAAGSVGDISLVASWRAVTYSITINLVHGTVNGTIPTEYTVENGEIIIPAPERVGYTFAGWLVGDSSSPVMNLTVDAGSTGDVTATATWTPVTYKIVINLANGTATGNYPTEYTVENGTINISDPERSGYTFAGWTYDGASAPVKNFSIQTGSTGNVTLTATWTVIEYNITYVLGDGVNNAGNPTKFTVESQKINLASPTKDYYTFSGWMTVEGNPVDNIPKGSVGDITLVAIWAPIDYDIKYVLNGGDNAEGAYHSYNVEISLTFKDAERKGYKFLGWYTDSSFTNKIEQIKIGSHGEITLYAKWEIITYKIEYDLMGGTIEGKNPDSYTVESDDIYFIAPTKENYIFAGWALNGEIIEMITPGKSGDMKLVATWKLPEFKLSYELNGGTNAEGNPTEFNKESEFTLLDPTKKDYDFAGWFTDADCTVAFEGIKPGMNANVKVYAKWTPTKYKINYEIGEGATNHPNNPLYYTVEDGYISFAYPERHFFYFNGWKVNGSSISGSIYAKNYSGDITVTAVWNPMSFSVYYNLNGGTNAEGNPSSFKADNVPTIADPTRDGYKFAGWYTDYDLTKPFVSIYELMESGSYVNIYAKWTPETYTIDYDLLGGSLGVKMPETFTVEDLPLYLPTPSKLGVSFGGWYSDAELTEEVGFAITKTGSVKLYAKYGSGTEGVGYTKSEDGTYYIVTSYEGTDTTVIIASEYDGLPVKEIAANAFQSKTGIKVIVVPDSVTLIGASAFAGCSSLESLTVPFLGAKATRNSDSEYLYPLGYVFGTSSYSGSTSVQQPHSNGAGSYSNTYYYIPNSLKSLCVTSADIPYGAVKACKYIKTVMLGEGVTNIADMAFVGCNALSKVVGGENVTNIGERAFDSCYSLREFNFSNKLTAIGKQAFSSSGLTSAILPDGILSIGDRAFSYSDVEAVRIPATVTTLGTHIFYECDRLVSAEISDGITVIAESTFDMCNLLTDFTIPESVKTIGKRAFAYVGATEITVPKSVEFIDFNAFASLKLEKITLPFIGTSLTETDVNKSAFAYIFGADEVYDGTNTPDTLKEVIILGGRIGDYAFLNCDNIVKLTIPQDLTEIGEYAFSGCVKLESVNLPEKITVIPQRAFEDCRALKEITLHEGITTIKEAAFDRCKSLVSVVLPESIKTVEYYAFNYCSELISIIIPEGVESVHRQAFDDCTKLRIFACFGFDRADVFFTDTTIQSDSRIVWDFGGRVGETEDGLRWALLSDNTVLIYGIGKTDIVELNVPEKIEGYPVTTIQAGSFANLTSLKSIVIPNSVTYIGASILSGCTALESITLPFIGESYDELLSIDLEKSANSNFRLSWLFNEYGSYSGPDTLKTVTITGDAVIAPYAFYDCSIITTVNIVGNLKAIGNYSFAGCSSLEAIILPDSVSYIGDYAFMYAYALSEVTFGTGLEFIGESAFSSCNNLKKVNAPSVEAWCNIKYETLYTNPIYLTGSLYINGEAVTEITVPDGVTDILGMFYGFKTLESVTLPDSVEVIPDGAFSECEKLSSIKLGKNVNIIGESAFYKTAIKEIVLPKGITSIARYTFYYCEKLEKVSIPEGVTVIDEYAFAYCSALKEINVPDSVETIAAYALNHCMSLEKISIGTGLRFVGYCAFESCEMLTEVHIKDLAAWFNIEFNSEYSNPLSGISYVSSYKDINNGLYLNGTLLTNLTVPAGVTAIYEYAFCGLTTLESVTIGSEVLTIGKYAFANCKALRTAKLSEGVTDIGHYAFSKCTSLEGIVLPDSAINLGEYMFRGCSSLESFVIGKNNTFIPTGMFMSTGLTSVVIADNITVINSEAFYGCNKLVHVTIGSNVTRIYSEAFYGCGALREVRNLSGLTVTKGDSGNGYVGYYAFSVYTGDNSGIIKDENGFVTYFDGTDTILIAYEGTDANIVIPGGITKIADRVFEGQTHIKSLVIPASVKKFGTRILSGCTSLEVLTVSSFGDGEGNYTFIGYLFGATSTSSQRDALPKSLHKIVVTDVTAIPEYAFYDLRYVHEYVLPEGLVSIGRYAFAYSKGFATLTIPSTVTSISSNAFQYCNKLYIVYNNSSLNLSDGYIGSYAEHIYNPGDTLPEVYTDENGFVILIDGNDKILIDYVGNDTNIVIPDGITKIISYAVIAPDATEITVPDSVVYFEEYAFYNVESLKTITIPFVGEKADGTGNTRFGHIFSNYTTDSSDYTPKSLEKIIVNGGVIGDNAFICLRAKVKEVVINEGTTVIGEAAFKDRSSLTSIKLPSTLKTICTDAFRGCMGLTEIIIPDGVEVIGKYAFYGLLVTEISVPDSVTTLGVYVFSSCTRLESIKLPSTLTTIPNSAFEGCYALTEIVLPETVTTIGDAAFMFCRSLKKINLPKGLTKIESAAFRDTGFVEFIVPDHITEIGSGAFKECASLRKIVIGKGVSAIGDVAFYDCFNLIEVFNYSSLNIVKGATTYGEIARYAIAVYGEGEESIAKNENGFITITDGENKYLISYEGEGGDITIPAGVTVIMTGAFEGNSTIVSVKIPEGVVTVSDRAFAGCTALKSIEFCTTLTTIGKSAFAGCTSLESIVIPDNVTSVGDSAFENCTALKSATVGSGVSTLSKYSFAGCTSLTEVTLKEGVTALYQYCFMDCTSLKEIVLPVSLKKIAAQVFSGTDIKTVTLQNTGSWYYNTNGFYNGSRRNFNYVTNIVSYVTGSYASYYWYKQ